MQIFRSFMRAKFASKASILGGIAGIAAISMAVAAVLVSTGPTSMFATAQVLPANSQPLGLFELSLSQDAGESLSSITVRVNNVAPAAVVPTDIASLRVYKDNGDGNFNVASDMLAGSQSAVNIDADTTITTAVNNTIATSTSKFFVALTSGSTWSSTTTPDTITVTFPSNGLVVGTPTSTVAVTAVTTPQIQADSVAPVLSSVVAQDTAATATKTAGDTLVFTFSEATNKPAITTANVESTLSVNNSHSFKNGGGVLGTTVWNGAGTQLTLTLNDNGFGVPTVAVGDMVAAIGSLITDAAGNAVTGSATITGTFGSLFGSTVTTEVRNASNVDITNTSVALGTAVHDHAVVSGIGSTTTATGTVTFDLYAASNCTGSVLSTQQVVLVNGSAASNATSTLAVGNYGYKASYAGNTMYAASTGVCEPFSIVGATTNLNPTINSNIQNASNTNITGQTVTPGTVVHHYAVISGSNGTPTGNVDFMRYTNATCSGDPAATDSNVALNGIGAAASSNFTTVLGQLSYRVHYDGNGTYLPKDGACQTITVAETVPPDTNGSNCSNGLINGRLYIVQGRAKVYLAAACRLKEFKGNAVGHAKGKKFQDLIPLPQSSVDENGNIVKTFTVIQLDSKPAKVKSENSLKEKKEKNENKGRGSENRGGDDDDDEDDD